MGTAGTMLLAIAFTALSSRPARSKE